ncbi:hypothetical protein B0H65DRAFT_447383 [Neurospora tetraspora]|uniref:Uncharacterized protein n=1 Tax=Neurospora tetraspora TaxID=94610 RepID=A0AAE0JMS0_9PEZI|nr:hypothetical protein B0H65DRAFT_447383 [Neurospora tetraspora]
MVSTCLIAYRKVPFVRISTPRQLPCCIFWYFFPVISCAFSPCDCRFYIESMLGLSLPSGSLADFIASPNWPVCILSHFCLFDRHVISEFLRAGPPENVDEFGDPQRSTDFRRPTQLRCLCPGPLKPSRRPIARARGNVYAMPIGPRRQAFLR